MIVIAKKVAETAVNAPKTALNVSDGKNTKANAEAAKTANKGRKKNT